MARTLSDEGAAFTAEQEGTVKRNGMHVLYNDTLGHATIGIGHLVHAGPINGSEPEEFKRGLTDEQTWELFRRDASVYVDAVNRLVTVPLTQRQFDMAVDFCFNWGVGETGGFPATSVLRLLNAGDFAGVAHELVNGRGPRTAQYPDGRPYDKGLAGVRRRRALEAQAFVMSPVDIIRAVIADLEAAGVPVQEIDGWEDRGRPWAFNPRGLVCFPAEVTVLCERGLVPISDVVVGDRVLTHECRWRSVTEVGHRDAPTVAISGHGHPALEVTAEHPFLSRKQKTYPHNKRGRRLFEDREWVPAGEMADRVWASPAVFPEAEPPSDLNLTPELAWVLGYWLANGAGYITKRGHGRISLSAPTRLVPEVESRVRSAGFACSVQPAAGACSEIVFGGTTLVGTFKEHFGRYSHGKTIPAWLLGSHEKYRTAVLDGYLAGDGWAYTAEGRAPRNEPRTVSRALAIGVKLLAQSLGGTGTLYSRQLNRRWIVHQHSDPRREWQLRLTMGHTQQQQIWRQGDLLFSVARKVLAGPIQTVYNISVDEDESFVADGIVVHNCHHTATKAHSYDYPSLGIVRDGRSDLPGPLAQFGIGRHTGTVYIIAGGHANHAGGGGWDGLAGNGSVWGIEAENDGVGEDWGDGILRSYIALSAALCRHGGFTPDRVCRHAEWSDGGKIDTATWPLDDGDWIRARVAEALNAPEPTPEPPPEPETEVSDLFIFDYFEGESHKGILYSDGFYYWGVTGETLAFYNTGKVPHVGAKGRGFLDDLTFREKDRSRQNALVALADASPTDLVDVDGCVTLYGPVEALVASGDGS